MGSDAELIRDTHDLARELLSRPERPDAAQVIALARERFAGRMDAMALN